MCAGGGYDRVELKKPTNSRHFTCLKFNYLSLIDRRLLHRCKAPLSGSQLVWGRWTTNTVGNNENRGETCPFICRGCNQSHLHEPRLSVICLLRPRFPNVLRERWLAEQTDACGQPTGGVFTVFCFTSGFSLSRSSW